jgi:hypothetical protein
MAQSKTRAPAKRARKPKQQSGTNHRSRTKQQSRTRQPSRTTAKPKQQNPVKAATEAAQSTTRDAGEAIGKAAVRAKAPLLAGGAALAGAAGGMAIGALRSRHNGSHEMLGMKLPRPGRVKLRSGDVARAAKGVGSFSQHLGELATELGEEDGARRNGRHRSPVEVVLDGLTARR